MIKLNIVGMSCMHCVKAVTETLASVQGVEGVPEVRLDPGSAVVEGNASPDELIAAIKAAGYEATLAQ